MMQYIGKTYVEGEDGLYKLQIYVDAIEDGLLVASANPGGLREIEGEKEQQAIDQFLEGSRDTL